MTHTIKIKQRVMKKDYTVTEKTITLFMPCKKHGTYICKCKKSIT